MKTSKKTQEVTLSGQQLEIMNIIWEQGSLSATAIWEVLKQKRSVARTTIATVIKRLEDKGHLKRIKDGRQTLYQATREQSQVKKSLLNKLLQGVFSGSTSGLIRALLHDNNISKTEADEIQFAIKNAEKETK